MPVKKARMTNLILISKLIEVLAVWTPRNKVRISRPEFWILLITRDLPPLESKAGVDAKCLIIEVPGTILSAREEAQL